MLSNRLLYTTSKNIYNIYNTFINVDNNENNNNLYSLNSLNLNNKANILINLYSTYNSTSNKAYRKDRFNTELPKEEKSKSSYASKKYGKEEKSEDKKYGGKPYGSKPSYSEKKSFNDKTSYSSEKKSYSEKPYEKKSYGDKSYGDKPSFSKERKSSFSGGSYKKDSYNSKPYSKADSSERPKSYSNGRNFADRPSSKYGDDSRSNDAESPKSRRYFESDGRDAKKYRPKVADENSFNTKSFKPKSIERRERPAYQPTSTRSTFSKKRDSFVEVDDAEEVDNFAEDNDNIEFKAEELLFQRAPSNKSKAAKKFQKTFKREISNKEEDFVDEEEIDDEKIFRQMRQKSKTDKFKKNDEFVTEDEEDITFKVDENDEELVKINTKRASKIVKAQSKLNRVAPKRSEEPYMADKTDRTTSKSKPYYPESNFKTPKYAATSPSADLRDDFLTEDNHRASAPSAISKKKLEGILDTLEMVDDPLLKGVSTSYSPTIISESKDIVFINKPLGMAVDSGVNINADSTLSYWLGEKFGLAKEDSTEPAKAVDEISLVDENGEMKQFEPSSEIKNIFKNVVVPAHKLERYTSGIVVCSKNATVNRFLYLDFQRHGRIRQEFLAIVHGVPTVAKPAESIKEEVRTYANLTPEDAAKAVIPWKDVMPYQLIEASLRVNKLPITKAQVVPTGAEGSKSASTWINVLGTSTDKAFSLVLCSPLTNRSHQIRAHLSYIGNPILNDLLYDTTKNLMVNSPYLLHAWRMSIPDPARTEKITLENAEAELPEHFTNILTQKGFDMAKIKETLANIREKPVWHDNILLAGTNRMKRRLGKLLIKSL